MDTSRLLYVHGMGIYTPPPPMCAHPTIMFEIATFSSHSESESLAPDRSILFLASSRPPSGALRIRVTFIKYNNSIYYISIKLFDSLLLTSFNFQTVVVRRPDYWGFIRKAYIRSWQRGWGGGWPWDEDRLMERDEDSRFTQYCKVRNG